MTWDDRPLRGVQKVTGSVDAVFSGIQTITGSVIIGEQPISTTPSGVQTITGSVIIGEQPIQVTGSIQTTQGTSGVLPTRISRYLDTDGDGTGTKNATGNYSGASDIFYIQPSAGQVFRIERLLIFIQGEKGKIKYDWYRESNALTNGLTIRVQDNSGTIIDFTNAVRVKKIFHYMRMCGTSVVITDPGEDALDNQQAASATLDFTAATGFPIRLSGDDNERLEVVLNDNFSSLDEHYFMAQGYQE